MKWYFCIDLPGLVRYGDYIKAAIASCRKHTDLQPICVAYDPDNKFPEDMKKYFADTGTVLIRHEARAPLLAEQLGVNFESIHMLKGTAQGAYLRFEVPLIETEDEFVLYTDCDVVFNGPVDLSGLRPRFFACAPEFYANAWDYCNTGVMLMNVQGMRLTYNALMATTVSRLAAGINWAYDQGDLNAFYFKAWDRLPLEYNWKPYWGVNADARIVHFHGPKPNDVTRMTGGGEGPAIYRQLLDIDPASYDHHMALYNDMVAEAAKLAR